MDHLLTLILIIVIVWAFILDPLATYLENRILGRRPPEDD